MYIYSVAVILYYGYNHLIQYDPTLYINVLVTISCYVCMIPLFKDTSVIRTQPYSNVTVSTDIVRTKDYVTMIPLRGGCMKHHESSTLFYPGRK